MTLPSLSASHSVSSCRDLPISFFFFPPNSSYAFITTVTWWRSVRKGVAQSDFPLFVSISQRLLLLRLPHLFYFFFHPNPSSVFITTVTWWRSARKGVALLDFPLFVSIPQRLLLLRPTPCLFFNKSQSRQWIQNSQIRNFWTSHII